MWTGGSPGGCADELPGGLADVWSGGSTDVWLIEWLGG